MPRLCKNVQFAVLNRCKNVHSLFCVSANCGIAGLRDCGNSGLTIIGCTGADLRGNEIVLPSDSKKQAIELRNVVGVLR